MIMKPGLGRGRRFDMLVLPRHDVPLSPSRPQEEKGNVLVTELAPNRIIGLTGRASQVTGHGIGLLIGGDAKNFKLTKESVENTIDAIVKIAEEMDYCISVTTSRRTSSGIDSFLKDRLGGHKRCKLLIIANENNIEGTVQNILEMSEIVVVSSESVSMISEAVSSGRYVVVFRPKQENKKRAKYDKVIGDLEKRGYIKVASPDGVYETIRGLLRAHPAIKMPEDRDRIIERLSGII